jgi:putative methyltransferase (TIGR01177 family)
MLYKFQLSGENHALAKFELETLLGKKLRRKQEFVSVNLTLSEKQVYKLCNRASMIKKCYFNGKKIWSTKIDKRFVGREPKKKLKAHPAMLKPKLARLLINLTGSQKQLLDPFCGTGSVLIEASVLGLKPIVSDIERKMVWYSTLNMEQFKVKAKLIQLDATQLETKFKLNSIEAIACDPPYGKSSTLAGKKIQELYPKFLESAHKILKPKSRLVMIRPHFLKFRISKDWTKLGEFDWYVHGGLIRKILILKKLQVKPA